MSEERWESGKLIAFGEVVVIATAMVTGVMAANWNGKATATKETKQEAGRPVAPASSAPVRQAAATPSVSDIEACNLYAQSASASNPSDVIEKAVMGGAIGAGVGAAGGAIAGGGSGAGKGAAIGSIVGATAGTLYGLNDANHKDARAVVAYRACMREHGYTSN
jgi:hypothetical protein